MTCKIQVLVCTSTLAWGMNFPTHLVIVKGTEYFDAKVSHPIFPHSISESLSDPLLYLSIYLLSPQEKRYVVRRPSQWLQRRVELAQIHTGLRSGREARNAFKTIFKSKSLIF